MKAKVINGLSDYSGVIIDVRLLDYNYVLGMLPGGYTKVKLPFEDVEFIYEYEWEKNIVKHRDLLKISLPDTVSIKFYGALCSVVEEHFGSTIRDVLIIGDSNEKARKGYWYKRLEIIINGSYPVSISASGGDYTNLYNIRAEDVNIDNYVDGCKDGINILKEKIKRDVKQLRFYEKVLHDLTNPKKEGPKAIGDR